MDDVRTVTLRSGGQLPLLGFGTWQARRNEAYEAVRYALESGYRHIDTATMYANEGEVGRALRDSGVPRDEVFVTTKIPADRAGNEARTLTASLQALDLTYVDLWLIHWPPAHDGSVDMWRAMLAAREAGLTRAAGVSNFSPAQLAELTRATGETPEVNQIPWSPWDYDAQVADEHRRAGVVLEGYSPFKRSDLDSPVLTEIATAHQVKPTQVILRWHLQHGVVVIPKSVRPERIAENANIFGFTLDPDEVARIDALGRT